jgi:hypothetical protein
MKTFDFQGETVCICRRRETLFVLLDERRSHLRSQIRWNRRESSRPQRSLLSRNLDGLVGQQRLRTLRDRRCGWADPSFDVVESIKRWKFRDMKANIKMTGIIASLESEKCWCPSLHYIVVNLPIPKMSNFWLKRQKKSSQKNEEHFRVLFLK